MADLISPAPPAASPSRRPFSPAEAAMLLRLAEGDFVKNLVRASLQTQAGQTKAAPAENFSGQDLETLGGDARGGSVNLIV